MIEVLDSAQPWEVPLPHTWEDRERVLEARHESYGSRRWRWVDGRWLHPSSDPKWTVGMTFSDVVKWCMDRGWRLYSLPMPPDQTETEETDR